MRHLSVDAWGRPTIRRPPPLGGLRRCGAAAAGLLALAAAPGPGARNDLDAAEAAEGYRLLWNGRNLAGWDGDPELWRIEEGALVGSTDGRPLQQNSFLISDRSYGDFILRFEVKLRNGNSGLQFRSERVAGWTVRGYQVDFAGGKGWGNLHGEGLPGGLILDGWQNKSEFVVRPGWNRIELLCKGHRIRIAINGLEVNDMLEPGALEGVLAFQLHRGEAMRVEFRNVRIRELAGR